MSTAMLTLRRNKSVATAGVLLVALVLVGVVANDQYRSLTNLQNVLAQAVPLGLVCLGQTFVILTGGIDLSVGSTISLVSMLTSGLINGHAGLVVPVVILLLALGFAIGVVNGLVIVGLHVHPVIVTLGMQYILVGACLLYSATPKGSVPTWFSSLSYGTVAGVPEGFVLLIFLYAVVWVFLKRVRLGRFIFAIGGSAESSRLSGISSRRVLVFTYALCSLFAASCGILLTSRLGIGDPNMGLGWELFSITPVVIGGTILAGGRGGVVGTLVGVLLMSALANLLNYLGVSTYYQWIIQGVIVIAAVGVFLEKRVRA